MLDKLSGKLTGKLTNLPDISEIWRFCLIAQQFSQRLLKLQLVFLAEPVTNSYIYTDSYSYDKARDCFSDYFFEVSFFTNFHKPYSAEL